MSVIRLTPKQGSAVAEIVRDFTEAGKAVEVESFKSSREVNVISGTNVFNVGGKGKVTEVA